MGESFLRGRFNFDVNPKDKKENWNICIEENSAKVVKMSLNTAHANNGVLLHAGESILLFCDNVIMGFSARGTAFDGEKNGRLYLTSHRMVKPKDHFCSPLIKNSLSFLLGFQQQES